MGEAELAAWVQTQAKPIFDRVDGAPFQPGDRVRVIARADNTIDTSFVGRVGQVRYLEYECGCGQQFPDDPMIGVTFDEGDEEELWAEELETHA